MPRRSRQVVKVLHADGGRLREGVQQIQAELGVTAEFPAEVLQAAERAVREPRLPDLDRTDIPFVTVDPEGSMDLDQALHLERDGDGYVVHYAIADVAAFVAPGDPVDVEANKRGETLFGADSRVPLHPPAISEDAASLLPSVSARGGVSKAGSSAGARAAWRVGIGPSEADSGCRSFRWGLGLIGELPPSRCVALTLIIFVPLLGAGVMMLIPRAEEELHKWVAPETPPNFPEVESGNLILAFPYRDDGSGRWTDFGRWAEVLGRGEPMYGNVGDFPEHERPSQEALEVDYDPWEGVEWSEEERRWGAVHQPLRIRQEHPVLMGV